MFKKLFKGSLSESEKQEIKDLKVIDYHSHIGNILERKPEQIWEKKEFPVDIRTIGANLGKFKHPSPLIKKIMEFKPIKNYFIKSGKRRNESANLYTFEESMRESGISKAVCLPIEPAQNFYDLIEAKWASGNKIIPFSSIDFNLFKKIKPQKVEEEIELKFIKELMHGSKGLKIHPIIQGIAPDTEQISKVIDIWTEISEQLAIIFHTGITEYCTEDEKCPHKPQYGSIDYFEYIAKNHPKAKIVIGHSGLLQVDEVISRLYKYDNVYVDTSFQPSEKIKELITKFGKEKVLFASDWPYGDRIPAIKVMLHTLDELQKTFGEDIKEKIFRENAKKLMQI